MKDQVLKLTFIGASNVEKFIARMWFCLVELWGVIFSSQEATQEVALEKQRPSRSRNPSPSQCRLVYLGLNLSISLYKSIFIFSLSLSLSLSLSNQPVTPKFTQLGIWVSYHRVLCFDFRGRGMTLKCFLFLFYKIFLFSFNSKIIKKKI